MIIPQYVRTALSRRYFNWNSIHGREIGEAEQDTEGLQEMRTLATNMAFLMKSIALGKEKYGIPEKERAVCSYEFYSVSKKGGGLYEAKNDSQNCGRHCYDGGFASAYDL